MSVPTYYRILIIVISVRYFQICLCQKFDKEYTGVTLTPYVKLPIDGTKTPDWTKYTAKDVEAMLEVILERFSKVATLGSGYNRGPYMPNFTYHTSSYVEAYVSEIAAEINRRRGKRSISTLQGIWPHDEPQMETEVKLAMEGVELANKIYPGTVEGILLSQLNVASNYGRAEQTRKYQAFLRNSSIGHLKIGIWMECEGIFGNHRGHTPEEKHMKLLQSILQESNFIICKIDPPSHMLSNGPVAAFNSITNTLIEFRRKLHKVNGKMEVMAQVKWASLGYNPWNSIENQKIYWETASHWGKLNSFPIWFFEAVDNPWRPQDEFAHSGWWKLTDNTKSGQRAGYVEKSAKNETENYKDSTNTMSVVSIASIIVGLLIIIVLVVVIVFQHIRGEQLQQQLSKQDIREFMEGMSDEVVAQQGDHNIMDGSAFKFPYNKSLEIKKENLIIDKRKILGTGQSGCVYKAVIESLSEDFKHVALKVAKNDCPRIALKGILSEIKIMMYIGSHPNIVALRGAYTAELQKSIVYIATEFCSLGSLESYLRNQEIMSKATDNSANLRRLVEMEPVSLTYLNTCESVTYPEMIQWSQEIACGMEYLGTKNVVHADLAARNILLTVEKTAKITDFGLSRRMYDYTNYVKSEQEPLPWRWMAIESLKRCEFSAKSDVWSYGVTLWEIFSMGDTPYPGLSWTTHFVNTLVDGLRLSQPTYATPEIYKIMLDCWNIEVGERPNFSIIQNAIKKINTGGRGTKN